MADPQAVDAIDSGNLVGILDTFGGLDLAEQRRPRVGGRKLLGYRSLLIAIMGNAQGNAPSPIRIIFHGIDNGLCFCGGADHRDHDPFRSQVARPRDVVTARHRRGESLIRPPSTMCICSLIVGANR